MVADHLQSMVTAELPLDRGPVMLEAKVPYLVKLKERLALPFRMNGKSLCTYQAALADLSARIITDSSLQYDLVAPGYHGPLYLYLVSRSFPVWIAENTSVVQLRLSVGNGPIPADPFPRRHRWLDERHQDLKR